MPRRTPPSKTTQPASEEASRERRERLRRDRERQRVKTVTTPPSTSKSKSKSNAKSNPAPATAAATAVRPKHEGLVSWLVRSVNTIFAAMGRGLHGFALEVVSVFAALGRSLLYLIPGVRRIADARRGEVTAPTPRRASVKIGRIGSLLRSSVSAPPRTGPAAERAATARRDRMRRRFRLVLLVLLLASFIAAAIVVPRSDAFRIRHIEMTGARAVGDLQMRERIDSLLEGKTLFTVDTTAISRRIETFPFVRSVSVERHLPGGLEVHITEYRPLALAYGAGAYWLVARDGRILAKADRDEWRGRVPLVTLRSSKIKPGMRVGDEPALLLLAARGSRSPLTFEVIEAEDFRLVATLPSGIEIRFGLPTDLRQKVLSAEVALAEARRAKITPRYVDVSVPSKPAICDRNLTACGMARIGGEVDDGAIEGAATTPEELGGDEDVVEAATGA
ncbi:MAG: FtsQ-type POTRA domain-containing protein [Gaiellales bacterium]